MLNSRMENVTVPTEALIETIRAEHITHAVPVRDQEGRPGLALFNNNRLRIVLTDAEAIAVSDYLTTQELETMFTTTEGTQP